MASKTRTRSTGTESAPGPSSVSPLAKLRARKTTHNVHLASIIEKELVQVIDAMIDQGALISFSRTSDGGALCVYVRDGDDGEKLYAATPEELQSHFMDLRAAYIT